MCTEINMPARVFNNSPYRIAGAPYKYPTQVQYGDITATFIGDKFLRLRTFFELWEKTMKSDPRSILKRSTNNLTTLNHAIITLLINHFGRLREKKDNLSI